MPENMRFQPFSKKQLTVLTWWCRGSPYSRCDSILCDGAVRSGKTICMSLSFLAWAFYQFSDAFCHLRQNGRLTAAQCGAAAAACPA